jgi:hypothetical protein
MSMFKKIKSLFVVEEETGKNSQNTNEVTSQKQTEPDPIQGSVQKTSAINKASITQFLKVLAEAIEKNNIEGYDYLEYKEAVKSLEKLETDEGKRFLTAFTLAQTMGAQKEQLLKSASFYLGILNEEENKFGTALQKQIDEKVLSGKDSIKKLEENITKKKEDIQKLETDIEKMKLRLEGMKGELEKSTLKVATVKNSFNHAYKSIVKQINEDINKIEKYIKS